ncbi:Cfr10I/Bse634I family restriction endonuclease [Micromonospora sp. NPDC007271]|uniref:Cfr10I/Bse634I family restriction endonuclease n=1 Tax=Micromonospora sp. NPDC007271 TaxID=3154587 RepID=UPI0033FA76D6
MRLIEDRRNTPVRGRDTQFRLAQQNMLAYTFDASVPGWGPPGLNSMPFLQVAKRAIENALDEGNLLYGEDFNVTSNAIAKVTGDIYEQLTSTILWETAAHWNSFMCGGPWPTSPRYGRPAIEPNARRQVAVLNLPRRYDWVRLLVPDARTKIGAIRQQLAERDLSMPTSTPDIAIVVLPEDIAKNEVWRTPLGNLSRSSQQIVSRAHLRVEGQLEPGEIILAMALKSSLRSDRLYQPLYEANVMQFLLEGHLGAPRVEFEVHALTTEGTRAGRIYQAASLHSAGTDHAHRAVRELYEPADATQIVQRFLQFLNSRMALVDATSTAQVDLVAIDHYPSAVDSGAEEQIAVAVDLAPDWARHGAHRRGVPGRPASSPGQGALFS